MSKKISKIVIMLVTIICSVHFVTDVFAGWAQVTVVLKADQYTVKSGYKLFEATKMCGEVQSISKYNVVYVEYYKSDIGKTQCQGNTMILAPGQGDEVDVKIKTSNYHMIQLYGNNIEAIKRRKDCIAYGNIKD